MDWDAGRVSAVGMESAQASDARQSASPAALQRRLLAFLRGFRVGPLFYYREQLLANARRHHWVVTVNLSHVAAFDQELQDLLLKNPKEQLPLLENAAKEMLAQLLVASTQGQEAVADVAGFDNAALRAANLPDIQAILTSDQAPVALRHVHAQEINRLVKVPGIVISATRVRTKCVSATLRCRNCGHTKRVAVSGMGGVSIPRVCDRNRDEENLAPGDLCPKDSYMVLPDKGEYVDQQTLKLQENPEVVPTGEMPRNLALIADRHLVDRASPGTRVSVVGITSVVNAGGRNVGAVAIRTLYLRVVGIEIDEEGAGRAKATFSPAEEEKFHEMARDPNLYEKLATSIAPSIYGDYTVNMKKAIACLLAGGSRKRLPDGMILRGDINVLLLGDPSTAKSQFLKFTEKIAPVGVYTSGKGSSAAGLTASVIRDSKGEFYLEGGAMVLADGGVVCIDEFDKMRESDRVAIHEAMEQQTISIAKAGITTILNSRASVLAAANPVFGRYDDMRSASENIDLMSTILSRFDMIFIVRDIQDDARDRQMAAHVVRMHTNALASAAGKPSASESASSGGEFEPWLLKKFITYCRTRCAPRLSVGAAQALQDFYVGVRDDVRRTQGGETTIPVTVRQLEALVRISESLAKMHLLNEATREHVQEAIRLFSVSTMNAAKDGGTQGLFGGFHEKAQEVEQSINRTLRIGTRVETSALYSRLEAQGYNPNAIQRAIRAMVQKGSLRQLSQYKFVSRVK
ncbi:DNA replication licensing factor MCM5 [Phytophthora citrophthora]|uniref:DNA replication licensing factor MCM5 n=1 Tax=Phytophthora citrophthora TaxID=4793 RepID=A0AAD9LLS4_9STRA|nr:DNA replication licensing factor MCM5 [Phytophthora citrophthora]